MRNFRLPFLLAVALGLSGGSAAAQSTFESNTVRHGSYNKAVQLPSANPVECQSICLADPRCVTWTFYKPGIQAIHALCMTRYTVADPYPSGCCSSGIVASRVKK